LRLVLFQRKPSTFYAPPQARLLWLGRVKQWDLLEAAVHQI